MIQALAEKKDPELTIASALIPYISDPSPEIRSETVLALARIGQPDPDLVNALIPLLSDEHKDVRAASLAAGKAPMKNS